MKKTPQLKLLVLLVMFVTGSMSLIAQQDVKPCTMHSDQDQIIEQCLSFRPLVQKIPNEVLARITEYEILDSGIAFKSSLNIEIHDKATTLISNEDLSQSQAYFSFEELSIENDRASVEYKFTYVNNGIGYTISISAVLGIFNDHWSVMNYEITN